MKNDINKFLEFSNLLADEAKSISMKYFKKKFKIDNKLTKGFDPVTIVDVKIQKKLNRLVLHHFPNHSILGEEESFIKSGEFEWCIDPIDGTKSFIQGIPLWGTLISLSVRNQIILGLADIPALDERYIGYSNVSYKITKKKKEKLQVSKIKKLSEVSLNTTSPYVFANKNDQKDFERLSKKVRSTRLGGDCYSYCLLADGHVDMVVESGLKPWDIRALVPIIKNAGGVINTWEGDEVFNGGRIIACSNNTLLKKSSSILKKKPSSK